MRLGDHRGWITTIGQVGDKERDREMARLRRRRGRLAFIVWWGEADSQGAGEDGDY